MQCKLLLHLLFRTRAVAPQHHQFAQEPREVTDPCRNMLKYSPFWARMFRHLHGGGQGNGSSLCGRNHQRAEPWLGWESVAVTPALLTDLQG